MVTTISSSSVRIIGLVVAMLDPYNLENITHNTQTYKNM